MAFKNLFVWVFVFGGFCLFFVGGGVGGFCFVLLKCFSFPTNAAPEKLGRLQATGRALCCSVEHQQTTLSHWSFCQDRFSVMVVGFSAADSGMGWAVASVPPVADRQTHRNGCLVLAEHSQAQQGGIIPSPAPHRAPPCQASTSGQGVEERIYPWKPSQLHLEHYKSPGTINILGKPSGASTPLHWGCRNKWEENPTPERCAKYPRISPQLQWKQNQRPLRLRGCALYPFGSPAANRNPRIPENSLGIAEPLFPNLACNKGNTGLFIQDDDRSTSHCPDFEIQFWAGAADEHRQLPQKHPRYLKQNTLFLLKKKKKENTLFLTTSFIFPIKLP